MPKIKRPTSAYDKLIILVNGYLALNRKQLADVLGCSYNTARNRLNDPATFTLGELRIITRSLCIPIEEVRAALPY